MAAIAILLYGIVPVLSVAIFPFLVFLPTANAVPPAAESVTPCESEFVLANVAYGNVLKMSGT